jgi:acetyl-CoA C-acetyltransferase/acetyl-CoA acyltransferase 2
MLESLFDPHAGMPMAITAENLAERYGLTRTEVDAFALRSQKRARDAAAAGRFKEEIEAFPVRDRKGNITPLDRDEHAKPETTVQTLSGLKPVFKKDGVVTAGNASGIVDGAALCVVSTETEARRRGWKPLGRLVGYGIMGCDPKIMGIGPVPAAREALRRTGMTLEQMDLVEVNEAFAPQALAVQRELGIPEDRFNVDGGAIAIGHPLAASGTRIIQHLLYELRRRGKRYGLGSACIGGGQGIALIVEAV